MRTFGILLAGAIAAVVAVAETATAQTYPTKPVRIITPFAPGGGVEVTMRVLAQKITESGWPQVIVENRPGGGGTVAALAAKQAAPDGYTLLQADLASHAINATLIPDLPYDPDKDFKPITLMWSFPSTLSVPANSPAKSVAELVEYAKKKPGGLTYASQGIGAGGHLLGAMFAKSVGVPMTHVPYKGAGPAMVDLMAGRVDLFFGSYASVRSAVEGGQVRMLAITSKERLKELPNLQTMTEAGHPSVFLDAWFGLVGPAGLPDDIAKAVNERVVSVLKSPEMTQKLTEQGWMVTTSTPGEFSQLIKGDIVRLGQVLKESGAN